MAHVIIRVQWDGNTKLICRSTVHRRMLLEGLEESLEYRRRVRIKYGILPEICG